MMDDFIELSQILTGVSEMDEGLGRQYLERLKESAFQPQVQEILEVFQGLRGGPTLAEHVQAKIVENAKLRPAVCQIILLWFTSTMQDPSAPASGAPVLKYGTQEEYFSGLAWGIIGAHVPGLSGGYFGHWRYRPENEPK